MSEHGTISRYTNDSCRCASCRRAKKVYEGHRMMGRRSRNLIPARPARDYLRFLIVNGWGTYTLARKIGVSRSGLLKIANGESQLISARTADKILGTHLGDAPSAKVPRGKKAAWQIEMML